MDARDRSIALRQVISLGRDFHRASTRRSHAMRNDSTMRTLAAVPALIALIAAQGPSRAPIEGLWRNPIGSAIIAIAPCGNVLCGKVVWASGRGRREASKGAANVVGTIVLTGLKPALGKWLGTLFIPDDDIHVSARLQLIGARQLKLTGCAVAGLLCRSQIWTRADGPLPSGD
jgi:uncharacterized protein (DUF2147 family)